MKTIEYIEEYYTKLPKIDQQEMLQYCINITLTNGQKINEKEKIIRFLEDGITVEYGYSDHAGTKFEVYSIDKIKEIDIKRIN